MNGKKCIVVDLDNTLWGGIVGEDGVEGISLSLDPPGNWYMAFQQAILDRQQSGIILAINSRNNPDDAWKVIRTHLNMVLKERHFAATRINWNDKAQNFRELAEELNIGLDAMVFLDDDPTNRALVRALVPEVETPELPSHPSDYVHFFNTLPYFESDAITDEDKLRGSFYVTERLRKEEEKRSTSKEDFLKSLSLDFTVYEDRAESLSRLSQLTEKTNQFNIHKQPLSENDISEYIRSDRHSVFHARLRDRFGDYGIIAFAVVRKEPLVWHIESLLMSCRVFGRGVEEAFLSLILSRAKAAGATEAKIRFVESEKNAPARDFIQRTFTGSTRSLSEALNSPSWIQVNHG